MRIPPQAVAFIAKHEGRRLQPYRDVAGYWTVGVGHLVTRDKQAPQPEAIDDAECNRLLEADLQRFAAIVASVGEEVDPPLNDNEFTALLSLAFNIGMSAFLSSTLVRHLKAGDRRAAAEQFGRWVRAGGNVVPGLVARRAAERELFMTLVNPSDQA